MLNKKNITIVISLLLFYLLGSMVVNSVFLADDLGWRGVSFSETINHPNFTTRPLSAIPMGILVELMHYSDYYYYLAYIFVIISVYLVYKTLMLYVENELFAYLGTLFLYKVSGFQYINRGGQYSGSRVFIDKDVKEIPQYDDEYFINLKKFPYYYVKPLEGKIYVVRNEKDFFNAIKNN